MFRRLAGIKEDSDPPLDLDKLVLPPANAPKNLDRGWHQARRQPKEEFEADEATHVFTTFHIEEDDPLQLGDLVLLSEHEIRGGRLIQNSQMDDERAALFLQSLPEGVEYFLRIKFIWERDEGDWVVEDKIEPVRVERRKGQRAVEISPETRPGALTGINKPYYENAYPLRQWYMVSTHSGILTQPSWPC